MAFGNITTFYLPTTANAGSSMWGTDVRKLLDSADAADDQTTRTSHGTGGTVTRTENPYTTGPNSLETVADHGWAVDPTDMGGSAGALRYLKAGTHTATARMRDNGVLGKTGCRLDVFLYRVAASPSFARTLLDSWSSASFDTPVAGAFITVTAAKSVAEVILDAGETVQYSYQMVASGTAISGMIYYFATGTNGGVAIKIDHPGLGVLADTTGSSSGSGAASGVTGKVLATIGSSAGAGAASGSMSSTAATTGSAAGVGTASGAGSSVAGTTGTAAGAGSASGSASIVLGTVGTVDIGSGGVSPTINQIFAVLD